MLTAIADYLKTYGFGAYNTAGIPGLSLIRRDVNGLRCFLILQESLEDAGTTAEQVNRMICLLREKYPEGENLFRVVIHSENVSEQTILAETITQPVWFETADGILIGDDPADGYPPVRQWLTEFYMTPAERKKKRLSQTLSQYLTPVTTVILAANILYFLVLSILGNPGDSAFLYRMGAMRMGDAFEAGQWWRLLTSAFMHSSVPHLFNNMMVLWYLGIHLEKELGAVRYTILYLLGAVFADVIAALWYLRLGELWIVSVGASGAVFALAGAMLLIVLLSRGQYRGISSRRMMLMILVTLYHGITEITANVNNAAHLGGLVTGFVLALILQIGHRRPE